MWMSKKLVWLSWKKNTSQSEVKDHLCHQVQRSLTTLSLQENNSSLNEDFPCLFSRAILFFPFPALAGCMWITEMGLLLLCVSMEVHTRQNCLRGSELGQREEMVLLSTPHLFHTLSLLLNESVCPPWVGWPSHPLSRSKLEAQLLLLPQTSALKV